MNEPIPGGFFITMESIDGLGKTTQLELLAKALSEQYPVYVTKEPGDAKRGSAVGAGARNMLFKDPTTHKMHPGVADLLFFADHLQNSGDIEACLNQGLIVLSDRYADSQFAYCAASGRKALEWTTQLFVDHFGPVPDLTILLRARGPETYVDPIPPCRVTKKVEDISWALARGKARTGAEAGKQDAKTWNDVEQQREVQNAYLFYLEDQERTFVVDVWEHTSIDAIHQFILIETLRRLANRQTVSHYSAVPYADRKYERSLFTQVM